MHSHWIQKLPANQYGRDFVVGDLHGCFSELFLLLKFVHFDFSKDRLFSVGDLIDRGPDSHNVLTLLDEPWFFSVRGNHEQMLLDFWETPGAYEPYDHEWLLTFPSDLIRRTELKLQSLPYLIFVEGQAHTHLRPFYVMHAELYHPTGLLTQDMLDRGLNDLDRSKKHILWSRHVISEKLERQSRRQFHHPDLPTIFCGHTILDVPLQIESSIYIDTGAFIPYTTPAQSEVDHFGLSLLNCNTKQHYFASTARQFRGTVVEMESILPAPLN